MASARAKEYLSQAGLQFEEIDVATDAGVIPELTRLGQMEMPVIVICGLIIDGLDPAQLKQALEDTE
jgi:hypothetical protein